MFVFSFTKTKKKTNSVKKIIQNIGAIISSRNAEKFLTKVLFESTFQEERLEIENPQEEIHPNSFRSLF